MNSFFLARQKNGSCSGKHFIYKVANFFRVAVVYDGLASVEAIQYIQSMVYIMNMVFGGGQHELKNELNCLGLIDSSKRNDD
jgi:hypothetical protein